jgi:hypothetical protein
LELDFEDQTRAASKSYHLLSEIPRRIGPREMRFSRRGCTG